MMYFDITQKERDKYVKQFNRDRFKNLKAANYQIFVDRGTGAVPGTSLVLKLNKQCGWGTGE